MQQNAGDFADDSASIALAQSLLRDPSTLSGLAAVAADFNVIPTTITALKEHEVSLEESRKACGESQGEAQTAGA